MGTNTRRNRLRPPNLAGRMQIISAALILFCFASAPALVQAGADPNALTSDQQAIVNGLAQSPHEDNVVTLKLPDGSVKEYAVAPTGSIGLKVRLPLRNGKYITLVRRETVVEKDGSVTWRGEVEGTGERAVLMMWNNALLSGYVVYNGTILSVESLGGGIQAISEMDPLALPDHPPSASRDSAAITDEPVTPRTAPPEPKVAPFPDAQRQALEAKTITIDLMLLYTRNVTKHYIRDPDDLLVLAIDEVNETFRNSGLGNITFRLVYSQQLDYDGNVGEQFNHLYRLVDGVSPFENIKKLRNEKHADIVGLIIDNPNGCGLSTRVGAEADEAYFVVHHACATLTMSIAHEVGHILGARHDRTVDENNAPFAYAHGYVNGTKWRTMMSYKEGCGGCPRIPYWSNPRILYKGEPTGTVASDNARTILEQAERVSKFR
jgi:peptidyl-Asp metalloendopeptidase